MSEVDTGRCQRLTQLDVSKCQRLTQIDVGRWDKRMLFDCQNTHYLMSVLHIGGVGGGPIQYKTIFI